MNNVRSASFLHIFSNITEVTISFLKSLKHHDIRHNCVINAQTELCSLTFVLTIMDKWQCIAHG